MDGFRLLAGTLAFLIFLGVVEAIRHRAVLARLPIRIHVNGTRGKSSVTRLIAAGLREAGFVTCAKTTGTLPRMILPDGSEYPVFRPAKPNVLEQLRIMRTAADLDAEVIVIECMALQPPLQWLCEHRFVKATHGVITNAREDHLDVMGPAEEDVALALCGMVPTGGKLFTAERRHLPILEAAARDRGTRLVSVTAAERAAVTEEELDEFPYVEHAENVALALRVCHDFGIDRHTALRGMWRATPDPGVMTTHEIEFFGRTLYFVNGFAANDPESTERIWDIAIERFPDAQRRVAVFNCRADRADRSAQLGAACARWNDADKYLLIGSGTYVFAKAAADAGIDSRRLVFAEGLRVEEIFEAVLEQCGRRTLVMGMGNIGGPGLEIVRYFRNRSVPEDALA